MKQVTELMIRQFKIKEIGVDFMGYKLQKNEIYTFHHLIVPKKDGGPYDFWNGAILCGESSHPYLHLIECKDREIFERITKEMIEENLKGRIDAENLRRINDLLCCFEREHINDRGKKQRKLIKREYLARERYDIR